MTDDEIEQWVEAVGDAPPEVHARIVAVFANAQRRAAEADRIATYSQASPMSTVEWTPEMRAWLDEVMSRSKPLSVRQLDIIVPLARKVHEQSGAVAP